MTVAEELKKCRDLLNKLDEGVGTLTSFDIESDLGKGFLELVAEAVVAADEALASPTTKEPGQ